MGLRSRTKVFRGIGNPKQMVAGFFGKTAHVVTVLLEKRWAINSELYTKISLEKFEKRIIVHNGNASARTSAQISAFLTGQNVQSMGQPLRSPDLAVNDFLLFPHISQRFSPNTNFC